ncbi:ChaN family lipoprotein, partial [Marinobacter sp.]
MSIKFSNAALSGCKTGRFFMSHAPITLSLAVIPLMTGCSLLAPTPEPAPPQTHYHAPVVEAVSGTAVSGTAVSIPQLAERLAEQDVVMIGEYHGHQGAHLLQSRLQAHLYQHRPEQVLSMEQFEVDRQLVLDRY